MRADCQTYGVIVVPALRWPTKRADNSMTLPWVRDGYVVFAGRLRMWRQCAEAEHRRMRILNALGIDAHDDQPGWIILLLDAVVTEAPVVAATLVAECLTQQVQT